MIEFRFLTLRIVGYEDERLITFAPGLNIIAGPYGSGKSSLLEIMKYVLGGSATLSEAARTGARTVVAEVRIDGSNYTFERTINEPRVRVLQGGDVVQILHATSSKPKGTVLASSFFLELLGIPDVNVRRSNSTTAKESISFWDIYKFVYVTQDQMGQSITGHADSNTNRKRRRAFELLFGLIDSELAELEIEHGEKASEAVAEKKRLADVSDFLERSELPSVAQIQQRSEEISAQQIGAQGELTTIRSTIQEAASRLAAYQDQLDLALQKHSALSQAARDLQSEIAARERLAAQLALDRELAARATVTTSLFAGIDFRQCPRCLQALEESRVEEDHCYLCTQPVAVEAEQALDPTKGTDHLDAVQAEGALLLAEDEATLAIINSELEDSDALLASLRSAGEQHRRLTAAPLFERAGELSSTVARSEAELLRLATATKQWEERALIQRESETVAASAEAISQDVEERRAELESRRALVVELSATFDEIVEELELAWYSTTSVDLKTYLPKFPNAKFAELSGGQRTVVSVAYHLALLTVSMTHRTSIFLPGLLILDTPTKYLGKKDSEQVERNYRRIAAIVAAYDLPLQIVVAENETPPPSVTPAAFIELSYESPLIPGIEHPGGDAVRPLHTPYEEEE